MPKATSRAFSASGLIRPLNLDIIASAGLPGMSRGMKKLIVSAAHSVTTKNPSRRRTYLMAAAFGYLGVTCSRTCSTSGRL